MWTVCKQSDKCLTTDSLKYKNPVLVHLTISCVIFPPRQFQATDVMSTVSENSPKFNRLQINHWLSKLVLTAPVYQWLANNCSLKTLKNLKVKVKVAQWCLTLCDSMDYTVHGILQARILEWVGSLSLLQGIFLNQGLNPGFLYCRQFFTAWATSKA